MKLWLLTLMTALGLFASEEFFEAARKGDAAAIRTLLDGGTPVDAKWRYDQTALFIAARRGHAGVVKLLLERGANPNVQDSFYKMSALVGAATDGRAEVVRLLLNHQAKGTEQVLSVAAGQGNTAIIQAILDAGRVGAKALSQALALAESRKRSEAVDLLKKAGAVPAAAPAYPIDPAILAKYLGTYRNEGGQEMVFELHEGKLRGGAGGRWVPYGATSDTTFEPIQFPGMWQAIFVSAGDKVTGLELRSEQTVEKYSRVGGN